MKYLKALYRFTIYFFKIIYYRFRLIFYKDKAKFKDAYLFCERGDEARDNAYWMFKYYCEHSPKTNAYYVIDSSNKKDYDKVKVLGKTIEYGSFEHQMAILIGDTYISTHSGFLIPYNYRLFRALSGRRRHKHFISLMHGVIMNDATDAWNRHIMPLEILISCLIPEHEYVKKTYDYPEEVFKLTGFARYDNLNSYKTKNYILLMPTWRKYILNPSYSMEAKDDLELFLESDYYNHFSSLLNNPELDKMLKDNNLELYFYPHYEVQKFLDKFGVKSKRVKMLKREDYYIPDLLKEAKIMITDYSSVLFDFAYMLKPSIYYQFDVDAYFKGQYGRGYFDHARDGFGKVAKSEKEVILELKSIIKDNYKMPKEYQKRVNKTFKYRDDGNCKRIYNEIEALRK